jgi:DNA polymerase III delta prime subunit
MKHKLFYSKYRPKAIEDVVMLPRIKRDLMKDTQEIILDKNLLLFGGPGTGKSTISEILQEQHDTLKLNASLNTSVEDLRENISEFCRTMSIFGHDSNKHKLVYLDEFDGISGTFRNALKSFMETHDENVRFVATCNDMSKFEAALLSRFTVINFNPRSADESKHLKLGYFGIVKSKLAEAEIKFNPKDVANVINNLAPDFRSVWNELQRRHVNNEIIEEEILTANGDELYKFLLTEGDHTVKTYDYVMATWGDKIDTMLYLIGRPLCDLIIAQHTQYVASIPKILKLQIDYSRDAANNTSDPVVLALSLAFEVQKAILNK